MEYPFEFTIGGVPASLQGSGRSRERWKAAVAAATWARERVTDEAGYLIHGPLAVTIYYFPLTTMYGDVDNIVKPILDALVGIAFRDDQAIERVTVQKFEPEMGWSFAAPSDQLATLFEGALPVVYVRVDDDLSWRRL